MHTIDSLFAYFRGFVGEAGAGSWTAATGPFFLENAFFSDFLKLPRFGPPSALSPPSMFPFGAISVTCFKRSTDLLEVKGDPPLLLA